MTHGHTEPLSGLENSCWAYLGKHQEHIATQWTAMVCNTYPLGTAGFLRTVHEPFANPVGERTRNVADAFSKAVTTQHVFPEDDAKLLQAVEELVRVRAVQSATPDDAVHIFPAMKSITHPLMKELLQKTPHGNAAVQQDILFTIDARVDTIALAAFGYYCRCREQLAKIILEEQRRQHAQVTRLASRHATTVPTEKI